MAIWRPLFSFVSSKAPRALEIGSWEGRSAVFLLNELCKETGSLVCIDHFDLQHTDAGCERYRKITHNLSLTKKTYRILDQFSFPALMMLLEEEMNSSEPGFDWIYVDGSHEADDTLLDGELAWRLARKEAILVFDDYHWTKEPEDSIHHPKRGIDALMSLHQGEYRILSAPEQYQIILQKTVDMRIGFLVKEKVNDDSLSDAMGYGIHVAYAIDDSYLMPAAVSIRSLVKHTPGRVTVYIANRGLTVEMKQNLQLSLPQRDNVTLVFLDIPEHGLAADMGMVWAKIDLMRTLPVERALYLDADTFIRADVRELWNVDLNGKGLGAVRDVGLPMGHDGVGRCTYFNVGVLLVDLAQVRARIGELEALAWGMRDFAHKDQDALNVHFREHICELPLRWNGQGLGTYAKAASVDRDALELRQLHDPCLVHFTGPLHPDMASVINPWVQPYTSKPWGYAGAPEHPYGEEWWKMLDETMWKGYRTSEAFRKLRNERLTDAIKIGKELFEDRVRAATESK